MKNSHLLCFLESKYIIQKRALWDRYTKNGGVMLCFDMEKIINRIKPKIKELGGNFLHKNILYSEMVINKDISDFFSKNIKKRLLDYNFNLQHNLKQFNFNELNKYANRENYRTILLVESQKDNFEEQIEEVRQRFKDIDRVLIESIAFHKNKTWADESEYRFLFRGKGLDEYMHFKNGRSYISLPITKSEEEKDSSVIEKVIISSNYANKKEYLINYLAKKFPKDSWSEKIEVSSEY